MLYFSYVREGAKAMRVLVTGATGLVGRRLVLRLLERGDTVQILTRQPLRGLSLRKLGAHVFGGDITVPKTLPHALQYAEVVYHLAALRGPGLLSPPYQLTNVTGLEHILRAAEEANARRFVHVSDVLAYDAPDTKTTEDAPVSERRHRNAYAMSKAQGELLVRSASIETVIVRPTRIYDNGVLSSDLRYQVNQMWRFPVVFLAGGGTAQQDVIHADDVARLLIACGTTPAAAGRSYNAASGEILSWEKLLASDGHRVPAIVALPTSTESPTFTTTRAHQELDFIPQRHWDDAPLAMPGIHDIVPLSPEAFAARTHEEE
jgi:nucleoside-diphosphate-sugar epimerase